MYGCLAVGAASAQALAAAANKPVIGIHHMVSLTGVSYRNGTGDGMQVELTSSKPMLSHLFSLSQSHLNFRSSSY